MNDANEPGREIEALRERISALTGAILRISASLDVDTVLKEVAEAARGLTGARYAVITTEGDTGELEDVVMSGFTAEEERQVVEWTDNMQMFERLRDLPSPLRMADMRAFVAGLGLSTDGVIINTFQGTPMRHRGKHVGNFFLGEKETGPEFTEEDEDVLVLFASQAAAAVANARTHRAEMRARAHMEALVETAPVAVLVLDVGAGRPLSVNREARRLMEGLRTAGRPAEELPEVITCRFADGREIALGELPLTQALVNATTIRAEEMVLSVPDGRSVTTLVNATPIRSEDGKTVSVVVTLQDLAPFQELERLRAEFLSMVGHELRSPLTSIKGSAATLLEESTAFDPAERHEFYRIIHDQADHMRGLIGDLLDAGRIEAGTLSVASEPSEVAALVEGARNTFLSGGGRHSVLIDLPPGLPRVMADRRRIVQVLNNLLANAARHSPVTSPIRVAAVREGEHVAVSVSDEGKGVAPDVLPHLFRKYVGAAAGARPLADSGLGLVICKGLVEAHGGRIRAESGGAGRGTRFIFTLPLAEDAAQDAAAGFGPPPPSGPPPAPRAPIRVLVVDDDPQTLRFVRDALVGAGYSALVTGEHSELSQVIRAEKPHLVLLDLMLSGTDGIELMESVPELSDLPVIFISGYGRDETVARALEAGAADYIVKPFSPMELTARVAAALRRIARPEPFALGELAIHYEERRVTVAGREVDLTAKEYELLSVLSLNAGRVVAYDALLRRIWSGSEAGGIDLVRNFVKKLRAKLGDDADKPTWIFNVRGVGYRMANPRAS
ncbi:MAG: response regulator [Deltaproteobacteria bacterium]|nr:response regulator [Deltaproteobacteria bacterium]